jgi:hypothetical protein
MVQGDGSARRIALVVGNSAYQHLGTLANPRNDATAMATALQDLAFDEVITAIDLGHKDLLSRLQEFYAKLDGDAIALLYYAGHGVQVWGQNYLLPCDAEVIKASDLRNAAVPLNDVARAMSRRASTRLLFLDACRNDPLSDQAGGLVRGARSAPAIGSDLDNVGRGLAKVTASAGTFVAYATEPGNVALDGTGDNSPFTTALAQHIRVPGLVVDEIMMQVRVDVLDATDGQQLPWSESALTRRFQFKEGPARSSSRDFEQEYWDRVKDTDNPDFLESFLRQFPDGRHAEVARSRIGGVRAQKEAADWEAARSTDTIPALADFARRYPSSRRGAAARSRLFVKQLRRGSTILGAGVGGAIFASLIVWTILTAVLWVGRYVPGDWVSEIEKDPVGRLGPLVYSLVFVFGPSAVLGTLLWSGLTAYATKPLQRIGLALAVIVGPATVLQVGPYLLSPWSPTTKETLHATEEATSLNTKVIAAKKDPRYANDPLFKQEVAEHERSLKQAQSATYPSRVYHPLAASALAGLAAGWTLVLTALAISGRKGLAPWETPIVAGTLLAVVCSLMISAIAVDNPLWRLIETISYSCWGSVVVCAAFGLARSAALSHDTGTQHSPAAQGH